MSDLLNETTSKCSGLANDGSQACTKIRKVQVLDLCHFFGDQVVKSVTESMVVMVVMVTRQSGHCLALECCV